MSDICLQGHVSGRVQGVSYRAFTRSQAMTLGVTGFARNLADGRVEVLLCGSEKAVQAVVTVLRKGPPLARVDSIELSACAWRPCDGFHIE